MKKAYKYLVYSGIALGLLSATTAVGVYSYFSKDLPDVATLKDYTFGQQLQIKDINGNLLQDYGEEKRTPLSIDEFPENLRNAVVAIEDRRFFEHSGVDIKGTLRAVVSIVTSGGELTQGGSTITQQVARNFFLNNKKEITRKIREAILAFKIEKELSKQEILELYMNKIFLGHRSYGFAAAAKTYFNKDVKDLTLAQAALLAGIQQSPSVLNPIASVERATKRRNQVLADMLELQYITQAQYDEAVAEEVVVTQSTDRLQTDYITELARLSLVQKFGEDEALSHGYIVTVTIDKDIQNAAEKAVRQNLYDYDKRHGYRGAYKKYFEPGQAPEREVLQKMLRSEYSFEPLHPVVILSVSDKEAIAMDQDGNESRLNLNSVKWARKHISNDRLGAAPNKVSDVLHEGDMVYVQTTLKGDEFISTLGQIPAVNSGLVSIDSETGAIQALVGGFSYNLSSYNRATQAQLQVGSTMKPFIYSFALENGWNLGDGISDSPIRYKLDTGKIWQPKNYNNSYGGTMTLRQALAQSRNSVAVRLMLDERYTYVQAANYLARFGFEKDSYPKTPSLVLGTANFTPLEMVRAYAVFANGGFLVTPYLIEKIEDTNGNVIYQANPARACLDCDEKETPNVYEDAENARTVSHNNLLKLEILDDQLDAKNLKRGDVSEEATQSEEIGGGATERDPIENLVQILENNSATKFAPRVLNRDVAWLMRDALKTNIYGKPGYYSGTGARAAKELGNKDIGGKTGTTNNSRAAWFVGYAGRYTTAVVVAFDDNIELGAGEAGGKTALPAWINFEKEQLKARKDKNGKKVNTELNLPKPSNLIEYRVDPFSGCPSSGGYVEYYIDGNLPACLPGAYTPDTTEEETVDGTEGFEHLIPTEDGVAEDNGDGNDADRPAEAAPEKAPAKEAPAKEKEPAKESPEPAKEEPVKGSKDLNKDLF